MAFNLFTGYHTRMQPNGNFLCRGTLVLNPRRSSHSRLGMLKATLPKFHDEARNYERNTFKLYTKSSISSLFSQYAPHLDYRLFLAAAHVFPMRVNNYVVENLIDWSKVPNDPIFQLVFPQPGMLSKKELERILSAMSHQGTSRLALRDVAESIRGRLNPHPAGQKQENVPRVDGCPVQGIQHKYRETVLFFPTEGQFCHSFCTYCFRWAQFTSVGSDQQFKSNDAEFLRRYISLHKNVKDVLFTGGDPMVMTSKTLRRYIAPLLYGRETQHLNTIRIGTKSLSYWPYRYTSDPDAKAVLDLFTEVTKSGKHLSIQAHFSHPRELQNRDVQAAMRMIQMTGAVIRCQSPLIRYVNDDANSWSTMWNLQTKLGAIPYYMFVERDTGAKDYFSVPLAQAYQIFNSAYSNIAGTARTVRGPSMSVGPGKIGVVGIEDVAGERVFGLKFFQARNPAWLGQLFFAEFDPEATWISDLRPAFGKKEFFYEKEYLESLERISLGSSGQTAP